jgi:hypothetical protein
MHPIGTEQNITVPKKVANALNPGGYFVIQEFLDMIHPPSGQ